MILTLATSDISYLSLLDALPISVTAQLRLLPSVVRTLSARPRGGGFMQRARHVSILHGTPDVDVRRKLARQSHADRKSTRLNSSHVSISYAVFCLQKKNLHLNNI